MSEEVKKELWSLIASVELESDHPLAQAIVRHVQKQEILISQAMDVEAEKGCGVRVVLNDRSILIGNQKLLEKYQVEIPDEVQNTVDQMHAHGATVVLAAVDEKVMLALGIADAVKEDAASSLKKLGKYGIHHLIMLTGDHESTTQALATADIGIAMGSGTDVAIDSSDVVLIKSDLESLEVGMLIHEASILVVIFNAMRLMIRRKK